MGTYTHVAIVKRTVPRSKYDELVDFMEENMCHEGGGIDTEGYFISFSGRKWGRDRFDQKTDLAEKLDEIFEETKSKHWGAKKPQVFTRYGNTDKFSEWDWEETAGSSPDE